MLAGAVLGLGCGSTPRDVNFGTDAEADYRPPPDDTQPDTGDAAATADTTPGTAGAGGTTGAAGTGGAGGAAGSDAGTDVAPDGGDI